MDKKDKPVSPKDRRKYRRIEVTLRIQCKVKGDPEAAEIETVDISAGGMSVLMNKIRKVGTVLEFTMVFEKGLVFDCQGKVVWQDLRPRRDSLGKFSYLSGIEFLEIDLTERLKLIYYCHSREKAVRKNDEAGTL
jgi:c-di-GMP-binding flagellar brake protein YcgR